MNLTADQASDVPGDTLVYEWDLNYDGNTFDVDATGQTTLHTWNNPGLYQVGLRVKDEDGGETLDTAQVNINLPPVAAVGGPYSGLEGAPIIFDGSGSSDPDNDSLVYSWNFGDGSPAAGGITVTHAFPDNGWYTTTLTVIDADGSAATDSISVTVLNANPVVEAGPDQAAIEGVPFELVAVATDPGFGDTLSYVWDLDYDGSNFDEDAAGLSISPTFLNGPADFTIALRVRDDDYPYSTLAGGEIGEGIATRQVIVNNAPPAVNPGGPYVGLKDQSLALQGTATDVPGDTLIYEWDLGFDGLSFTPDLTGSAVTHKWAATGVYSIALRVTDSDGGVGLAATSVTIHSAPIAEAGGPFTGSEGAPIALQGSGSDADGDPLTYAWDLDNDGVFESPGQVVTNTWADDGSYTVGLQVSDGRGGIAIDQATVQVTNVPPSAEAGVDQTVLEGVPAIFSATASDPGADPLIYEWDFNYNGSAFDVDGAGQNVSTAFPDGPFSYTVALRVKDGDGGVTIDTALVTAQNVSPTAGAGGPYSTSSGVPVTLSGQGGDVPADSLQYAWDLDNDGTFETAGQEVQFLKTVTGTYTVTVQVSDDDGGSATATSEIHIID